MTVEGQVGGADDALWVHFVRATTVEAFCRGWLALQCRMIKDVASSVLLLGPPGTGPFVPAAFWPEGQHKPKHLAEIAERALAGRQGLSLTREMRSHPESPSRHRCHVAYPIQIAGRLYGVVALDIAPRPEPHLQAVMRQLQWGAAWLEVLFRREEGDKDAATKERLETVLDLAATVVGQERFHGAAMAFVTAVATRLACDRVSVGFVRQGRTHVLALSHSAHFGKQTNLMRAVGSAMDEALDQQATVVYPPAPNQPTRVTRAHAELGYLHGAGAICSTPLVANGRLCGVLTLERPTDRPFNSPTVELCEAVAGLVGPILEIYRRDDRSLPTKVADAARRQFQDLIGSRHVARKLAVVSLAALTAFFAVAKGDYRVAAKTVVEARIQRAAVAPFNGYVSEAPARAGDLVRQGQVLAVLDERELSLERLKWLSQHEQLVRQYHRAMAKHEAAQARILAAQIDQAKAQLSLLDDQLARTRVLAPFDGVVVTGDLSQSLGAPVERGQVLFEVAPLGAYRVVLQVDERDIAALSVGQRGQLLVSGFPSDPMPFTVEKITPVSTAREGRNYFRVEAQLQSAPERLRPGLEGVGKIEVDRRLLIWIWTHQVIDWVRLTLWTWLP